MSWDSYIDNMISQSKDSAGNAHMDRGCIIGLDGGASWTTSAHPNALQITPAEASLHAKCFKNGDFSPMQASGVHVAGDKYTFLRDEDKKIVYAKLKGKGGITFQKTKTAIVIGHTQEGKQQGNVNKAVGVVADYLEGLNM